MFYESDSNDIQIACTGESLISRELSKFREERFLKIVQMLRDADVTFTNAECLFHEFEGHPNTVAGGGSATGTYMATHPRIIKELKWLGIDVVSTANNHGSDYGEGGVLANIKNLEQAGMPHAGSGRNMAEARAPVYLDTPKGRVAVIAAADWGPRGRGGFPWPFPMGVMAGEQSAYSKGRPGYNLIRQRPTFTIDRESFDALRRLSKNLKFEEEKANRHSLWGAQRDEDTDTVFHFMDAKFVLGNSFSLATIAHPDDVKENLKWIRDARRMADWVLMSFHSHGASSSPDEPSEHTKVFARECIDAGADVFIGHGAHRDHGIEIYKNKPIFYSLGDFILQNDTVQWMPYEAMRRFGMNGWDNTPADFYDARSGGSTKPHGGPRGWETAIAMVSFKAGKLAEVRLHPVDLGMNASRGQRGRPLMAEPGGEVSKRVLEKFQQMSKPFGTEIKIDNGVGVIRLV